jgi:hypothetical protein
VFVAYPEAYQGLAAYTQVVYHGSYSCIPGVSVCIIVNPRSQPRNAVEGGVEGGGGTFKFFPRLLYNILYHSVNKPMPWASGLN